MNRAVVYVRVSTEEQARGGVSLDAQEDRAKAYCALAGLELVRVYREEGVSASKPLAKRPQGGALVKAVKAGGACHVVALKLDRLFRDTVDALTKTKEWDHAGVALHLVDMGGQALNTGSAMGRFFLSMMAGFAELERNLISERTATALAHKRRKREVFNHAPLGFRIEDGRLVEDQREMAVVRAIQRLRARGRSYHRIAAVLNRARVPTKRARTPGRREPPRWHAATVRGAPRHQIPDSGARNTTILPLRRDLEKLDVRLPPSNNTLSPWT